MQPNRWLFSLVACISVFLAYSQQFVEVLPSGSEGLYVSHNEWFDFDGDGDLDFIINGHIETNTHRMVVYENQGGNNFRKAISPFDVLPSYTEAPIAFVNPNHDDRIDFLIMGRRIGTATTHRTSLLMNTSTGFLDLGSTLFPVSEVGIAQGYGSVAAGDTDNDGRQDIYLSGLVFNPSTNTSEALPFFFKGQAQAPYFSRVFTIPFKGLEQGSGMFADVDNDRDLDLIAIGRERSTNKLAADIYLNNDGAFAIWNNNIAGYFNSSIDVANVDGDNFLDILVTGYDQNLIHHTQLYLSTGGNYTPVLGPLLDNVAGGSARFGDFDNDGDFDILAEASDGDHRIAIFRNNGNNNFELVNESGFSHQLTGGAASWGDYDRDGDLDIVASGITSVVDQTVNSGISIFRNTTAQVNQPPSKPGNLKVTTTAGVSTITWDKATDDRTTANSLTYNLTLLEGKVDSQNPAYLMYPYSDRVTGQRRIAASGNVWLNRGWKIKGLDDGIYHAKVQSIDAAFVGSAWSDPLAIYIGNPSAPSQLVGTFSNNKIQLSWTDNSNNEAFFIIEIADNTGNFTKIDSVSTDIKSWTSSEDLEEGSYGLRIYATNPNGKSAVSGVVSVVVVGVEENNNSPWRVYPVPSPGLLTFENGNVRLQSAVIELVHTTGVVIMREDVFFDRSGMATLDARSLPRGLYCARISSPGARALVKVLIQ